MGQCESIEFFGNVNIPGGLAVCIGAPSFGLLLIVIIIICCIAVCVCRRRKRGNLEMNNNGRMESGSQELTTPIDLATGQLGQDTVESSTSKSQSMSTDRNMHRKEIDEPYINKKINKDMENAVKPQMKLSLTPPPAQEKMLKSQEQTTSLSTECKHPPLLLDSGKDTKLLLASDVTISPTESNNPPQSPKLKKTPSYEEVRRAQETSNPDDKDGHMYDDVLTTLEISMSLQKQAACSQDEPKYHVLCDPDDKQKEKDLLTSHHYENRSVREGEASVSIPEDKTGVHTPQRRKHDYEEIRDVPTDSKQASTNAGSPQDRYNVLSNQLETNPLQGVVIQEDPSGSPVEDTYYSTTRVHRLVPVGKPIGPLGGDHFYQALDGQDQRGHGARSKDYEQVQGRHNTFTSSCISPNFRGSKENLIRTYSSTAQSLEKLDPMYDEPYKLLPRSNSLSRVDIYNVDSLFDDPKYVTKDSTRKVFDDPSYSTRPTGSQPDPPSSQAPERHVSFSTETKTRVEQKSLEGSGARPAAARKTK